MSEKYEDYEENAMVFKLLWQTDVHVSIIQLPVETELVRGTIKVNNIKWESWISIEC